MDEARIKLAAWEAVLEAETKCGEQVSVSALLCAIAAGIAEYDRQEKGKERKEKESD